MSAFNLFAPSPQNDCLVEFKAGKCTLEGKLVRPDKRKGLVQVKQSDEGLIHFIWKERVSGQVENDLIVFPDDAVFRKVKESNGRVYLLEFKNSGKKLFFWMQEFSDEKDEQYCTDINKYFTEPPTPGGEENSQIEQILQLASQQTGVPVDVLRSNLGERGVLPPRSGAGRPGGSRPAPTAASRPAPSASSGSGGADIRGILAGLGRGSSTPAPAPASNTADLRSMLGRLGGAQQPQQPKGPQLNDVINVDEIVASGLLEHEDVLQKLAEFLPPGPVTAQNLKDNLRSPQFQQAVTLFNQALRGGEMGTIMASFGLDVAGLGPNPTIEDFLQAIQKQVKKEADLKKQ